jgi:hypothetical protein
VTETASAHPRFRPRSAPAETRTERVPGLRLERLRRAARVAREAAARLRAQAIQLTRSR